MPCTYYVQTSVVVDVNHVGATRPLRVEGTKAVGNRKNQRCLVEGAIAATQKNALAAEIVGVSFGLAIGAHIFEGHDIHVSVVIDVARDEAWSVCHAKGRRHRRRQPFVRGWAEERDVCHAATRLFVLCFLRLGVAKSAAHNVEMPVVVEVYAGG